MRASLGRAMRFLAMLGGRGGGVGEGWVGGGGWRMVVVALPPVVATPGFIPESPSIPHWRQLAEHSWGRVGRLCGKIAGGNPGATLMPPCLGVSPTAFHDQFRQDSMAPRVRLWLL